MSQPLQIRQVAREKALPKWFSQSRPIHIMPPKRDLFGRAGATSNLKLWGNLKLWLDEPEVFGPDGFFRPTLQFDAVIIIYYRFGGKPIKLLGGHMDGRGGH
jgi:hypothetical protein